MFQKVKIVAIVMALGAVSACSDSTDRDFGVDSGTTEKFAAGIWIDGNGCDHWIIDDGIEGFMSPRLATDGRPICREGSVPFTVVHFRRSFIGLGA